MIWRWVSPALCAPLESRINEHFNAVFVSKVTRGNSIFGQIVYFALNSFVNLHLIRFEILGLCCINYPLAIFCAGSNSAHSKVVQGVPRVLQIRSKELSGAEKVFCPTKTLSECKLDIKSFPFTGHNSRNICATLRAWCWRTFTRTCRVTTPVRSPPRSSTRPCRWNTTSSSCVSVKIFLLRLNCKNLFGKDLDINWIFVRITLSGSSVGLTTVCWHRDIIVNQKWAQHQRKEIEKLN